MTDLLAIVFERPDEGAAFVAALSRQLAAPAFARSTAMVWGALRTMEHDERLVVYLDAAALEATERAFGERPAGRIVDGDAVTRTATLLVRAGSTPPLGRDQVLRALGTTHA